jgi:hypothetical protein
MRELDEALGLSCLASAALRYSRTGKNAVHLLDGLFRKSVFGRLAGYKDVNVADRLALDPVMRQVVGGWAVDAQAASTSQMGRFETETLALAENWATPAGLEEALGWAKTVEAVYRGLEWVRSRFILTMAANNLARLPRLLAA